MELLKLDCYSGDLPFSGVRCGLILLSNSSPKTTPSIGALTIQSRSMSIVKGSVILTF